MTKNIKELDGKDLIQMAQQRAGENNLEGAIEVFDEIVRRTKAKIPMPIFSRATCYIQLEKFQEAVDDCKLILQLPDGPIEEGLVAGSTTLHSAAYSRLNNAYKSLNKIEEAAEALKARSVLEDEARKEAAKKIESNKSSPSTEQSSTKPSASKIVSDTDNEVPASVKAKVEGLKTKANKLYQEAKFEEAIKIYKLALEHYSENAVIHSNISQAFIKIEKYNDSLLHANEAVRLRPEWAKGYYRQGKMFILFFLSC